MRSMEVEQEGSSDEETSHANLHQRPQIRKKVSLISRKKSFVA
jgi:hypothetical protein